MKSAEFRYRRPSSLDGALAMLAEETDGGKILAGGQSLVPLMALRFARPDCVIDVNGIADLAYVVAKEDALHVGALTRHRTLELDDWLAERCPIFREALALVGHVAIRNRGTVGGSMVHGDPAAEWPGLAMLLDAEFVLASLSGTRTVPASDFFLGPFTTCVEATEMLTEVRFHLPDPAAGTAFVELARRHGDYALAGAYASVTGGTDGSIASVHLTLIGVDSVPVRPTELETMLTGLRPTDPSIDAAVAEMAQSLTPVSDVHGSSEYRRTLATVVCKRALRAAWHRVRSAA